MGNIKIRLLFQTRIILNNIVVAKKKKQKTVNQVLFNYRGLLYCICHMKSREINKKSLIHWLASNQNTHYKGRPSTKLDYIFRILKDLQMVVWQLIRTNGCF